MVSWNVNNSEYNRFLNDLIVRESSGDQYSVNGWGYLGLYQMGEYALIDAGYFKGDGNGEGYQNFGGAWTGRNGVWSKQGFLNNAAAQKDAVYNFHQKVLGYVENRLAHDIDYYVGKVVHGVKITKSGILGGAHLLGQEGVKKFLDYGINGEDKYGTKISEYFQKFSGYDFDGGGSGGGSNDTKYGTNAANTIHGYDGDDKIYGKGGNDKLYGDSGNDKVYGGSGNDFVSGGYGNDIVSGGAGRDEVYGGSGNDKLYGNSGSDKLFGWYGNDHMFGGKGNDSLYGDSGNDRLYGGSGNDRLYGGSGNDYLRDDGGRDYFDGGTGYDTVSYYGWYGSTKANSKTLTVNLSTGKNNSADTYKSIENIFGSNKQKDYLTGTNGANTLDGNGGNDRLYGLGGNDRLEGGYGNDYLSGGSGNDFVTGQEGNDTVRGGSGNDAVYGGSGNDRLYGDSGNDKLYGWKGNDHLWGGSGSDTFVFGPGYGRDKIHDFDPSSKGDIIDVRGHRSVTSKQDLFNNHMKQNGANVELDLKGGDVLTLANLKVGDLDFNDFIV